MKRSCYASAKKKKKKEQNPQRAVGPCPRLLLGILANMSATTKNPPRCPHPTMSPAPPRLYRESSEISWTQIPASEAPCGCSVRVKFSLKEIKYLLSTY